MRTAISCAVINENKEILLVKKKETWIFPGGKPEEGESDLECLTREVKEELNDAKLKNLEYYDDFVDRTPHQGDLLKNIVYFADLVHETLEPSAEIKDAKFIKAIDFEKFNISKITKKALDQLKKTGYL